MNKIVKPLEDMIERWQDIAEKYSRSDGLRTALEQQLESLRGRRKG